MKNKFTEIFEVQKPYMAASIIDDMSDEDIILAKEQLDIIELRIDLFSDKSEKHILEFISKFSDKPVIATIRSQKEGGKWGGDEMEKLNFFKKIISKVNVVDVELSSEEIIDNVISEAKKNNCFVLVSSHNFSETPDIKKLEKVRDEAAKKGADIIKIATQINSDEDIKTLSNLLKNSSQKMVVIGMGEKGLKTRIEFPKQGSLFTFCSFKHSTAPGQISVSEMKKALNICS